MTVINLEQRRAALASNDVTACGNCGGQWFELRQNSPSGPTPGAICMNAAGRVSGYAGTPTCLDCGTPL